MLIITADDLGRDRGATDACMDCFREKKITSASIMVFMNDSRRAADLAIKEGLETGLHINLVLPYDAPGLPEDLKKSQNRTAAFFKRGPWTQVIYNPFIAEATAETIISQLEEYRRLFGRHPAYFNGHKHFHLSLNAILSGGVPRGAMVRRSFTFFRGEKPWPNRYYRRLIDAWLLKRYESTNDFFSLSPADDRPRLRGIIRLAQTRCVELMVHPWDPGHYRLLMGQDFADLAALCASGGFRMFKPKPRAIPDRNSS